jgi:ABC-type lipoprotein export system ATPase subunit
MALDESFGMVAQSLEPRVAEFLHEVSRQTGMQIILITHSEAYGDYADARYRLVLGPDGVTQVFEGESE